MNLPHLIKNAGIPKETIQIAKKNELIVPKKGMLYIVMSGAVIEVLENPELSKSHIKRLLGQGDIFPLYVPHSNYNLENILYQTTIPGSIVQLSHEFFLKFLQESSEATFLYMQYLGQITQQQEARAENKVFLSSKENLIKILIQLAENPQFTRNYDGQKDIRIGLTHDQIGSLALCSRQTVTQTLNHLENDGLLKYNRNRILIYDVKKLREYLESLS